MKFSQRLLYQIFRIKSLNTDNFIGENKNKQANNPNNNKQTKSLNMDLDSER